MIDRLHNGIEHECQPESVDEALTLALRTYLMHPTEANGERIEGLLRNRRTAEHTASLIADGAGGCDDK
jgi:hypothetical protein